ncbi:MAG TPA: DNA polymerase III subunit delta [Methylomirabilota bacterium]|nr:DNA polymerase III subunit delta [Methylomirabilota bacterium]
MDYAALLQSAARAQPPALALVHGADAQLLDDALSAVTRGLFADATEAALGREVLEGVESTADAVVRAASTLPFMTSRRLVAVRRAHQLPAKGADALAAYARDPNPASCLLLLADEPLGASRDRRSDHWLLQAMPPAAVVTLPAREGRSLEAWLRERAAADGLTVGEDAARLLVQWVGDDTAALLGEARKAALAGGPQNTSVGVKDVTAVVGEQRLSGVFDLTRAVQRRELGAALRTLDRLLAAEEPVRLLALLVADVRATLTIAELAAQGQSVDQIARAVRKPAPVVDAIARGAAAGPRATLTRRLVRCWHAERRLKSSADARAELAALVVDLCR